MCQGILNYNGIASVFPYGLRLAVCAGIASTLISAQRVKAQEPQGSVLGWGTRVIGVDLFGGYTAVAAGEVFSLGLKANGSIVGWGSNSERQLNIPSPNSEFVAVSGGWSHSLGLKANGTIITWGSNKYGQLFVPFPNSDFIDVASGAYHNLGIKTDGSIVAWGRNESGQLNVPVPNSDFTILALRR